jgi:hypothetical protein
VHPARVHRLRTVIERKQLIPLDVLCRMHAGEVVKTNSDRIEAFYTQTWAFARFLCEGENGRYFPALQKLLSDAAAGRAYHVPGTRADEWNPALVKPLLEHYLGTDLNTIDQQFTGYMKDLAFNHFDEQFEQDAD